MLWLLANAAAADGELGQRVLGSVGLDAGTQSPEGVYAGDRFFYYSADRLLNRKGEPLPIKGLEIDAYANVIGVSGTIKPDGWPYLSAAFAVPVAWMSTQADLPPTDIGRSGLGDLVVQPLKIGWRSQRYDAVGSYAFYAPTGQLNREGLGQPQWTQQLSLGGTLFFDDDRGWRLSALASYNHYHRKLSIDLTRGDTVQLQGGFGAKFFQILDFGVAAYALWQVADDTGSALPAAARGARERVYGVGPEIGITIPAIRGKLTARYEWDLGARARTEGQILVVSLSLLAWPLP
ncbi:SphA family protein [Methylotetracoccus oryzae]|uniref:SphA family protein n=1 Tax=Methylotetracoccus oryzae TaxID=1919059 RepID=UPI0013A57D40|nr:transporter [Methylotetracoccus oryzae]